jgi:hypothetical protein
MRRHAFASLLLALALAAASGCVGKQQEGPAEGLSGTLAVAGFTQPAHSWELLAGYVPENVPLVDQEVLYSLDRILLELAKPGPGLAVLWPGTTRQCQEIAMFERGGERGSALDYWLEVGRCMGADWLLVPQVLEWRQRKGTELGVQTPASVMLELFVVDVAEGRVAMRHHFEETQRSLSENLLDAGKFLRRGAAWITAEELAREGMAIGLARFGL